MVSVSSSSTQASSLRHHHHHHHSSASSAAALRRHRYTSVLLVLVTIGVILVQFALVPFLFSVILGQQQHHHHHQYHDHHHHHHGASSSASTATRPILRGTPAYYGDARYEDEEQEQDRRQHPKPKYDTISNSGGGTGSNSGRTADGTLNGIPLYLQKNKPIRDVVSRVHCVGDNYRNDAWQQRSCRFTNLCLNTTDREFVVLEHPTDALLSDRYLEEREHMHFSSVMRTNRTAKPSVSLGGINLQWGKNGIPRIEWFPRIIQTTTSPARGENNAATTLSSGATLSYYALPDNVVMIPFHSMNGKNPGHLVWDDFLPMYTLLRMFQLEDRALLPLRYMLNLDEINPRGLWASCDIRDQNANACQKMISKFLPLMVGLDYPYQFTTNKHVQFRPNIPNDNNGAVELVCAKHGAAGIASLTDHGPSKMHGWVETDHDTTHNHGRGGMLFDFRNFMMQNMGLPGRSGAPSGARGGRHHRIVISEHSSDIGSRSISFTKRIALLKQKLPSTHNATVENYTMKDLSLREQVRIVHDASVYITLCGGGAVTGMFLPAGASLIVFYNEDGGVSNARRNYKPAMLDWDLLNSMSHLRVHWMPRTTRHSKLDENAFLALVRHELDLIESNVFTTS